MSVSASFDYLQRAPVYKHEKPYEVFLPLASFGDKRNTVSRSNLVFETRHVPVKDIRGTEDRYSLDVHGFQFAKHACSAAMTAAADLGDADTVAQKYVPEMEAFLKRMLGGDERDIRTFCFDIRLRKSIDPDEFSKKTVNLENGLDPLLPATHPHIDQSPTGAIRRVHRHLGDEAETLLQGRVRIINLWRPLATVRAWPLAVCAAASLTDANLEPCDIVRRRFVGETLFGTYSPQQQWFYLSAQRPDEVALLKIYDSDASVPAKHCLHSSFPLEETGVNGLRESLEIRLLVFSPS